MAVDNDKITYEDIKKYEFIFSKAPTMVLKVMIKTTADVVAKFKTKILLVASGLNDNQKSLIKKVFNMNVDEIQQLMDEAYKKSNIKQYKILADKNSKKFIEKNLDELKKLISNKL